MATKFEMILCRSNTEIKQDRAHRIASAAQRAQQKLIFDLEAKRDAVLEAISAAKDLSTSNSKLSINAIDQFQAEDWVQSLQKNKVELRYINEDLKDAVDTYDEMLTDSEEFDTDGSVDESGVEED